ncbi:MAG TPA: hypothetical protein VMV69_15015 [Pirellulales bacterium]|nr:hypothetical protein [Pirellulales bacterium]
MNRAPLRHFATAQIKRLCQFHTVPRAFATEPTLPIRVPGGLDERVDLLLRAAHHELTRRDQTQFHSQRVFDVDFRVQVFRPGFLISNRLLGVERGNCQRGDNRRKRSLPEHSVALDHPHLAGNQLHFEPDRVPTVQNELVGLEVQLTILDAQTVPARFQHDLVGLGPFDRRPLDRRPLDRRPLPVDDNVDRRVVDFDPHRSLFGLQKQNDAS